MVLSTLDATVGAIFDVHPLTGFRTVFVTNLFPIAIGLRR